MYNLESDKPEIYEFSPGCCGPERMKASERMMESGGLEERRGEEEVLM